MIADTVGLTVELDSEFLEGQVKVLTRLVEKQRKMLRQKEICIKSLTRELAERDREIDMTRQLRFALPGLH